MTHHAAPTASDMTCPHPANDLIEAVAFGYASDEEIRQLLDHVATCAVCTDALEQARFAAQVLPFAAPDPPGALPERVWSGIEQRIAATPEVAPLASPVAVPARSPLRLHWAVAAMLAVLTLAAGVLVGSLLLNRGDDTDVHSSEIAVTDTASGASGTLTYLDDRGVMVLNMADMPAAPTGSVYQVWMIAGEAPVPVGVFDPQSGEFAAAGDPSRFDALAITVEPGPVGSGAPTTAPILVVDLAELRDN